MKFISWCSRPQLSDSRIVLAAAKANFKPRSSLGGPLATQPRQKKIIQKPLLDVESGIVWIPSGWREHTSDRCSVNSGISQVTRLDHRESLLLHLRLSIVFCLIVAASPHLHLLFVTALPVTSQHWFLFFVHPLLPSTLSSVHWSVFFRAVVKGSGKEGSGFGLLTHWVICA